jgi:hypothetical protein
LEARGYKVKDGSFVFPKALKDLTVDELISLSDIIEIPAYYFQEKFGLPQAGKGDKLARKTTTNPQPVETSPAASQNQSPAAPEPPTPDPKKPDKKANLSDSEPTGFWREFFGFFADARTLGSRALSALNLADKSTNFTSGINIDKLFEQALKEIYAEYGIDPKDMPPVNKTLFDISNKSLQKGIDKAFSVEFGKSDPEFINQFKTNAAVFAAFKTHAQGKEIVAQLIDENGKLRSFDKFRKEVLGTTIKADYNINWLRTEHNMAIRATRMAEKLKRFAKTLHLYPNLKFLESTATHKRAAHLKWVGTILPFGHWWWNTHTPPVEWGCECDITNTDEEVTGVPDGDVVVDPVFQNNPAETAEFINIKEHPMVKAVTDEEIANNIKKFAKQAMAEELEKITEKKFKSGGVLQKPINFKQNSQEEKKNIKAYTALAKEYGGQYKLLTVLNEDNHKNPDALNLKTLMYSDAKIPESEIAKNAIQNSIKSASEQKIVSEVYIYLEREFPMLEIWKGLKAALQGNRAKTVKKIIIRLKNGELKTYDVEKLKSVFNKKSKGNIK